MNKVVIFYSDSCVPCSQMKPVYLPALEEIGMNVELVPVHEQTGKQHSDRYGITSVPTLLFVEDNIVVHIMQGYDGNKRPQDSKRDFLEVVSRVFGN